jgi:hypothetical protein
MTEEVQDWRRKRLEDALTARFDGNRDAFGKALGYKNGRYIGQLLNRDRPISEETVAKIEDVRGLKGWFKRNDTDMASDTWAQERSALYALLTAFITTRPEPEAMRLLGAFEATTSTMEANGELPPEAKAMVERWRRLLAARSSEGT